MTSFPAQTLISPQFYSLSISPIYFTQWHKLPEFSQLRHCCLSWSGTHQYPLASSSDWFSSAVWLQTNYQFSRHDRPHFEYQIQIQILYSPSFTPLKNKYIWTLTVTMTSKTRQENSSFACHYGSWWRTTVRNKLLIWLKKDWAVQEMDHLDKICTHGYTERSTQRVPVQSPLFPLNFTGGIKI